MNLREKAINGVLWNATGSFASHAIEFIVGIVLARLLTPHEFGLVGSIMIFILVSQIFINSGFSQALVRKQNCTQTDYSTVFFFNLLVGLLFFLILFALAGPISDFFNNPELKPLIRVLGIGLIISALALIQRAKLTKKIDFKLQTKITTIAGIFSGIVAVILAYMGFGVWSLVAKYLINQGLISLFLWVWNRWMPGLIFSRSSFKELFGFGSYLLLSGLIGTIFQNIYHVVIARFFSPADLGFYTRADLFRRLPSENMYSIATAVGYPLLATIQDDPAQMKLVFRKMLLTTFFVIAILMAGMAATANAMILSLVGEQWLPSVPLLQLLCIFGVMVPMNSLNINILNVVGRSDLYMKLQLITQSLIIPNIFVGVFLGIKALIIGQIVIALFGYYIFNRESIKVINYSLKEQLRDVLPSALLALFMAIIVYIVGMLSYSFSPPAILILQVLTGATIVISFGELCKLNEYRFIKQTIINKILLLVQPKSF